MNGTAITNRLQNSFKIKDKNLYGSSYYWNFRTSSFKQVACLTLKLISHTPVIITLFTLVYKDIKPRPLPELLSRYQWGFHYLFIITIKLNNIFFQILLQDKYNIGILTVHIALMWLGTKRMERIAKSSSFTRF